MIRETGIQGLLLIEPAIFEDDRGYFLESYNQKWLRFHYDTSWVQDNEALSKKGVLRGLHYQTGDHAQAKLVRVVQGKVLDVVVDLRPDSASHGKVFSDILSGENKKQILVPRGFAHGYVVLEDDTIFAYKCDNYYHKDSEGGIHPLDPTLDIDWMVPESEMNLSEKDQELPKFGDHKPAL